MSILEFPRSIKSTLLADLEVYPVVALMGARQVGKSTLASSIAAELGMPSRTLDDRDMLQHARTDPEGFLRELGDQGCIDEAQRAPELFLAIKAIVDRSRRAGQYLLCGSNQPVMRGAVGDSLLGRAAYRTLRPLTLSELRFEERHSGWSFLFDTNQDAVVRQLEMRAVAAGPLVWTEIVSAGGFPRIVAGPPSSRRQQLEDYLSAYTQRDIRDILDIESSDRFDAFVRLAAAFTGQELNLNGMSADLGTPVTTLRRWQDALERSYLVERIPSFSRNASQRVIKAPKLFFVDSALAMAAARVAAPTGFHLETFMASDLGVWRDGAPGRALYHWRTATKQEIDFILEMDGALVAVEVKSSATATAKQARHLQTFCERHPECRRGVLVTSDPEIRVLDDGTVLAPWWAVV